LHDFLHFPKCGNITKLKPLPAPAMPFRLFRFFTLPALLCVSCAALAAPLPAPLAGALRDAKIPGNNAAFFVQRVDSDKPLLTHNAGKAMNPASTMKLVTTYAALDLLGPAFTWKTQALTDAPMRDGKLEGHLYLRGSGDPSLTQERFWLLLRQLRARGVTDISGDLVLDRSAFRLPPHDPAAFDNEPLRPYNAGADALLINFKSLRLTLIPDPATRTTLLVQETPAEGLRVSSRIALTDGDCGDWREKLKIVSDTDRIEVSGSYASACGEKALHLAPWAADAQVERLFRALWRELGGTLSGKVREGETPASARLLATQESPPLGEIVRDINKWSNNVMARQLFLNAAPTRPATPEAAKTRIEQWLREKGIEGSILDNGAGLSREERISAESLGKLLLDAWKSPVMPELTASLPIAGSDGTLKKRFGNSAVAGRAHLKTGYIEGVRAIAGYVLDQNGRRWVVVGILNDAQMKNGSAPLDALVRWVAEH
jgi:D-alanyl-D-alanine carboxypeptidase/D-alanyl-D-alanine-endopeptidase (penicillin-binding protein 4)